MDIKGVYKNFDIPPNLRDHMIMVTKVVLFIKEHWVGPTIDWGTIVRAALLHDVGNMAKFDLDNHPHLLGAEEVNLDYWKQKQKEFIEKYGSDDHVATGKMLKEIGVDAETVEIILNKSFSNSVQTASSEDLYPKILLYADLRTLPFGVGTLEDRLVDIKTRMPKYFNRPDFQNLWDAVKEIEQQIQANLNTSVSEITNNSIGNKGEALLDTKI